MEEDEDDHQIAEREKAIRGSLIERRSLVRRFGDWRLRRRIRRREARAFENLVEMPAFARGAQANERAWQQLQQGMVYEAWLAEGGHQRAPLTDLPYEYVAMSLHWPDAFDFYRFYLYETLEGLLGLSPWNMTLRTTLTRARASDPDGFLSLDSKAWNAIERFSVQRAPGVSRAAGASRLQGVTADGGSRRRHPLTTPVE